jgi:L-ascorbate metabolism protein UlaG (beta-lactamase superfamily)
MKMIHTNPSEAVQIGIDLKAKNLIGMHWGTLDLSDEPMFEPPILFNKAGIEKKKNTIIMKIGDSIEMK